MIEDEDPGDGRVLELHLVPDHSLRSFNALDSASQQRCSYSLHSLKQALSHMTSIIRILKSVIHHDGYLSGTARTSHDSIASFDNHVVWLLDSLLSLNRVLLRYPSTVGVSALAGLKMASQLADVLGDDVVDGVSEMIRQKVHIILVIICSEVVEMSGGLFDTTEDGPEAQYILCSALIEVTRAAIAFKPVSRTVKAQLLWPLKALTQEHHLVGPETDLWVCVPLDDADDRIKHPNSILAATSST
jgi:serine/threonine-protein kinase ATR